MLFSGSVRIYECESCNSEYSDVLPTSILPLGMTLLFSAFTWGQIIRGSVETRWLAFAIGFVVAITAFTLIYWLADTINNRKIRGGDCPKCGENLKMKSSGVYDAVVPQPWELVIYAIVIGIPIIVRLATRST